MDFHHLKIFVTVYNCKSFTKASDKLNISQPTISEHIKNLESEFSCRLFDRLGRTISATPKADILYPKVMQLLDSLEKLNEEFLFEEGRVKGELIVGASTIPGTYILPRQASQFRSQHPGISFEIRINDTGKVSEMVLNHDVYLGVVGAKVDSSLLTYLPLVEDELVFVAAKASFHVQRPSQDVLMEMPFIVRELGSGTRDNMMCLLAQADIEASKLNVVATLGSSASVKEAVKAGLGVSCLSRLAVYEELAREELVEIPLKGLKLKRNFYLIYHKKRTLPNHYQAFCKYLAGLNQDLEATS